MRRQESFLYGAERNGPLRELLTETAILSIPGWNGSGVGHWQTLWEQKYSHFRRVEQRNWSRPSRTDWTTQITAEIERTAAPVFLVAHSLGCLAVAHWAVSAPKMTDRVGGAFLVAPPWIAQSHQSPRELLDFLPMPLRRLPFPSLLVASENDPYLPAEVAIRLAKAWASQFVNVGRQGHINVSSGHGPWLVGEGLLEAFIAQSLPSY